MINFFIYLNNYIQNLVNKYFPFFKGQKKPPFEDSPSQLDNSPQNSHSQNTHFEILPHKFIAPTYTPTETFAKLSELAFELSTRSLRKAKYPFPQETKENLPENLPIETKESNLPTENLPSKIFAELSELASEAKKANPIETKENNLTPPSPISYTVKKEFLDLEPELVQIIVDVDYIFGFNNQHLNILTYDNKFQQYFEIGGNYSENFKTEILQLTKKIIIYDASLGQDFEDLKILSLSQTKNPVTAIYPHHFESEEHRKFYIDNKKNMDYLAVMHKGWGEIHKRAETSQDYKNIINIYETAALHNTNQEIHKFHELTIKNSEYILKRVKKSLSTLDISDIEEGKKLYTILNKLLNAQSLNLPDRKDIENSLYIDIVQTKYICARKFNFSPKATDEVDLTAIGKQRSIYARSELKQFWEKDQGYIDNIRFDKYYLFMHKKTPLTPFEKHLSLINEPILRALGAIKVSPPPLDL